MTRNEEFRDGRFWSIRHNSVPLFATLFDQDWQVAEDDYRPATSAEKFLIEALLREPEVVENHQVYADWLEECGHETAALAHRLAAVGCQWRRVGGIHMCFVHAKVLGMVCRPESHRRTVGPPLSYRAQLQSDRTIPANQARAGEVQDGEVQYWSIVDDANDSAQASYQGRATIQSAIEYIYRHSWTCLKKTMTT